MTDPRLTPAPQTIVLLWESLGPYHHDRLRALARSGYRVQAIELAETSEDYRWDRSSSGDYAVTTLSAGPRRPSPVKLAWRIVRASRQTRARHLFFCHYDKAAVLLAAVVLRLTGRRIYTMVDSKFDDYPRRLTRECLKALFLLPYSGALVASRRSVEYLSFLGFGKRPIAQGYDTIDTGRFNRTIDPAAPQTPFAERPFVVVARLVPKKNLALVLRAYAQLDSTRAGARELHIIGYGPLLADLQQQAEVLGIAARTRFLGQQPSSFIADALTRSLAMILASTEEQFGLVVNEALATGTPVIVSNNAGAVDELVDNLGNGLVINPRNEVDLVRAMQFMAGLTETEWHAMSLRASHSAERGHVRHFCDGVTRLAGGASASS
jgi:glycosyltransferase involved in cell wall biosynthesis